VLVHSAEVSLYSDARPPLRFQHPTLVRLQTANQPVIDRLCASRFGPAPAGMRTNACQIGGMVVAPDPCSFPETDTYAQILCHEIGHANGWPATHGG
jgi:hypothetical protein